MQFIYVLLGWEGSAVDGKVLRDTIRRTNSLRVPHDAGYTNCTRFLAPFHGQGREMSYDGDNVILEESDDDEADESITTVEPSDQWSDMRMNLARHMSGDSMDTSKTKGPGQNKRFWTEKEDNKLIESLLELNNDGRFKVEGSFKPGHLNKLEKKLHEKLHGCDLLAKSHIESGMKTLKTHFQIVHDMLTGPNCSGFGWDIEKKTVTVEHPHSLIYFVVDIHSHKEVAPFKLKSSPYYDELSIIFGDNKLDDNASSKKVDNASDNNVDIQLVSKSSKRSQSQTECSGTSKKQRKDKSFGDLVEALTESTATLAAVIENSSACLSKFGCEILNEKHMQLDNELSRTTTLTIMEHHKVFRLIMQDNALVSYFFNLPDELKDDWAKVVLLKPARCSSQIL
ncbi:hypothetical protein Ddye_029886 [Dipteronia dyeriana]|uniref:Myb/SANT-like domain-containing protein n=1 Tax=Dipteronia dyeriana TaxID=168575 RepID=A0AAD9TF90_9ROSI|nr:hypothetical protein Ddye_029886 [Dipteronia dyeriana]